MEPPTHSKRPPPIDGAAWARLVDTGPFGVTVWRAETESLSDIRLIYANEAAARVSGVPMRGFVGRTVGDLFPSGVDAPPEHNIPAAWMRVACTERPETMDAVPYGDENHPPGWFRIHFVPLGDRRVASVYENITEELRAQRDLAQFASVASHDLQAPLRTVRGFVDLLRGALGEALPDKAARYLGFIDDGVDQMTGYIKGLLAYARAGRVQESAAVELGPLVERVRRSLAMPLTEAGATVEVEALPMVDAPRVAMVQLLQNLLDNALKYREPSRALVVRISARRVGAMWQVDVTDNGIGVPASRKDEVFEMFRRLHAPDDRGGGAGLGLAICNRLVERWGGRLSLRSTMGQGSTFTFTVPAVDAG